MLNRLVHKAWQLIDEGRFDEAREFCADAVDRGAVDCMLHYAYGRVLYECHDFVTARVHFQFALESLDLPLAAREKVESYLAELNRWLKNGVEVAGVLRKTVSLIGAGKHAEAVRVCEAGLAKHPDCAALRSWLGRAQLGLSDFPAARSQFVLALPSADLDDEFREMADTNLAYLDDLLRDPPEVARVRHQVQQAMEEKKYMDVRVGCVRGLKTHPGATRLRIPLALASMRLEDFPGAREQLKLVLKDAALDADDRTVARAILDEVTEGLMIGPEYASLLRRAWEALAGGRHEECRRWCESGLESHPDVKSLRVPCGLALIHLGNVGAAREHLSAALASRLMPTYQERARAYLAYAEDVLAYGPELHSFRTRAAEAFAARHYDQCLKWSACGLEMFPKVAWRFSVWQGLGLLHSCRFTAARDQLLAAQSHVSERQERSATLHGIVFVDALLRDQPDLNRAEAMAQEALQLAGTSPESHVSCGIVRIVAGQVDEGMALVRRHLYRCNVAHRALVRCFLAMEDTRRGDIERARIGLRLAKRDDNACALIELAEKHVGSLESRRTSSDRSDRPVL